MHIFTPSLCLILLFATLLPVGWANDTCSRTATINYQEILVDVHSSKRGEGLRPYLEKDPKSKEYLDEYQKAMIPKWYAAAIGTVGTALIIVGLNKSGSMEQGGFESKRTFMMSGISLLAINFFMHKTIEYNNEKLLLRSIDEYNKRNLPKIYFSPMKDFKKQRTSSTSEGGSGFIIGLSKTF